MDTFIPNRLKIFVPKLPTTPLINANNLDNITRHHLNTLVLGEFKNPDMGILPHDRTPNQQNVLSMPTAVNIIPRIPIIPTLTLNKPGMATRNENFRSVHVRPKPSTRKVGDTWTSSKGITYQVSLSKNNRRYWARIFLPRTLTTIQQFLPTQTILPTPTFLPTPIFSPIPIIHPTRTFLPAKPFLPPPMSPGSPPPPNTVDIIFHHEDQKTETHVLLSPKTKIQPPKLIFPVIPQIVPQPVSQPPPIYTYTHTHQTTSPYSPGIAGAKSPVVATHTHTHIHQVATSPTELSSPSPPEPEPTKTPPECGICYDDELEGYEVVNCCGKIICKTCIGRLRTNICPYCRVTLTQIDKKAQQKIAIKKAEDDFQARIEEQKETAKLLIGPIMESSRDAFKQFIRLNFPDLSPALAEKNRKLFKDRIFDRLLDQLLDQI